MGDDGRVAEVLDFWFGAPGDPGFGEDRAAWWTADADFDRAVRAAWAALHDEAAVGALDGWMDAPRSSAALVLLLDQAPRNLFRGSPRCFATDGKARRVTDRSLAAGYDRELPTIMRMFLYMPLEHSERLDDQERCVELMRGLGNQDYLDYAVRHRDIIRRFGRFPHRNVVLGRESTAEETAFLAQPNSSF